MDRWEDYYSVLQVHYRADSDMISGAYRRLSKKYHPDVNKGALAEEMMKRLNAAYGVLGDARKRAEYNVEWIRRVNTFGARSAGANAAWAPGGARRERGPDYRVAFDCIEAYYRAIRDRDFEAAYRCISAYDRKNIKKADFVKWQTAVSRTVELRGVSVDLFKKYLDRNMGKKSFAESLEFNVRICERNLAQDRFFDYVAAKSVVCENGVWGVYLGYRNLKPFIERFEGRGAEAVDAKSAAEHWLDYCSKHDRLTGILNLPGFLEAAGSEVSRSRRYDNIFSLAVFEVLHLGGAKPGAGGGDRGASAGSSAGAYGKARGEARAGETPGDDVVRLTGRLLIEKLRDIDIVCRWKDARFIALLTETNLESANKAVNRICGDFNARMLDANQRGSYHAIFAGVSQFDFDGIDTTLKKCAANLALAKRAGRRRAVTGIYTRLRKFRFLRYFPIQGNP